MYPTNPHDMLRAGYKLIQRRACKRGCGVTVEHWRTTNGVEIDFDPSQGEYVDTVPHARTCSKAKKRGPVVPADVERFAKARLANAVLVFDHSGLSDFAIALPYPDPADMHNQIVAAADRIKQFLNDQLGGEA